MDPVETWPFENIDHLSNHISGQISSRRQLEPGADSSGPQELYCAPSDGGFLGLFWLQVAS
jgi:hypothetical protein